MATIARSAVSLFIDIMWALRPRSGSKKLEAHELIQAASPTILPVDQTLRGLIKRFPYWKHGRRVLAQTSLAHNDVATAYAEGQALAMLSRSGTTYHTDALFILGRCHLRSGDGQTALRFFDEVHAQNPNDPTVQEERAAAFTLSGDRHKALDILRAIPAEKLSAEGKAALQWLSSSITT